MAEEKKKLYYEKLSKRLYSKTTEKVNPNYEKPCLEYNGYKNSVGYGMINIRENNKTVPKRANTISYALSKNIFIEDIPETNELGEKFIIRHGIFCNKLCIEPSHLNTYFQTLHERLYSKTVEKVNPNYEKPCLEFTGAVNTDGYGMIGIRINNKSIPKRTHRVSYALSQNIFVDDIPKENEKGEKLLVCHGHGCSKLCIEPTHLKLDTASVNMYEDKHRDGTINHGEKHYKSSITEELALQIKHSYGEGSQKDRSIRFGVSKDIVNNIDANHTWSHLPDRDGVVKSTVKKRKQNKETRSKNKEQDFSEDDWLRIQAIIREKSVDSEIIEKTVSTPCHLYQGAKDDYGYGFLTYRGKTRRAHIYSYESKIKSKVEKTLNVIRHMCNNRQCVNPEHLEIGTRSENSKDSLYNSKNAKLTEDDVKEIRKKLEYKMTCADIAKEFNVSYTTVANIKNGVSWR
jgi:hypothetical protein